MTNDRHVFNPEAYAEGLAAGKADRSLGRRSEYAWLGVVLDPVYSYSWHYSRGYRDAWHRQRSIRKERDQ